MCCKDEVIKKDFACDSKGTVVPNCLNLSPIIIDRVELLPLRIPLLERKPKEEPLEDRCEALTTLPHRLDCVLELEPIKMY